MGVTVVSADAAGALPPVACVAQAAPLLPPPHAALLDVSALLALISDATHLPPTDARLVRWASANEHWCRSLEEEAAAPLLPRLASVLAAHPRHPVGVARRLVGEPDHVGHRALYVESI